MKRCFQLMLVGVYLLICSISCSNAESQTRIRFPKTIYLISDEIETADIYLKYPFRVRLDDSSIHIMDIHPADYYVHKFKYPSLEYQQSYMKRGEAPGEFLDAENIRFDNQGSLWALDANKRKVVNFSGGLSTPLIKTVNLEEKLIRTLDFDFLNDSTFIVPDYTGEYRINLINLQGEITHRAFHIPMKAKMVNNTPPIVLAQAWRPFLNYNPEHGILALATQLGQVLEIYDINKEQVINVVGNEDNQPQFITKGSYAIPNGIMGYSDVHVGQEDIYALFWGHSFADIKAGKINKEGGNTVHVFSLDGTPKTEYKLDSHITGFHIDEKNKVIIGLDINSNQPLKKFKYE